MFLYSVFLHNRWRQFDSIHSDKVLLWQLFAVPSRARLTVINVRRRTQILWLFTIMALWNYNYGFTVSFPFKTEADVIILKTFGKT